MNQLEKFLHVVSIENFEKNYQNEISESTFFGRPLEPIVSAEESLLSKESKSICYFSMEYGLSANSYNRYISQKPENPRNFHSKHRVFSNMRAMDYYVRLEMKFPYDIPIYSGGLGVLAGDTLKSSADLKVPMAAVGILWNKGYFKQNFWFESGQMPLETVWDPWTYPGLIPLNTRVTIQLKREQIHLRLWKYYVFSFDLKHVIPLILLDSNLPENSERLRGLTNQLYRSDNEEWKFLQRAVLGLGGMKAIRALGYSINTFHLNEGHAALAFIEAAKDMSDQDQHTLQEHFAYTCHTPVAAGHDRFQEKTLSQIVPDKEMNLMRRYGKDRQYRDLINLTILAMNSCKFINAVSAKHGDVTRLQFPDYANRIQSITNGVHTHTWVSDPIAALLDRHADKIGNWRNDPKRLAQVSNLKDNEQFRNELWQAHQENKKNLCHLLRSWKMDPNVFTLCWARRIAAYKRPSLILRDINRLVEIAKRTGPIQILFAGKAHPQDNLGFTYINEILSSIDDLSTKRDWVRVVMLENYNTSFGKLLTSSVDVWLNNPLPPFEASGTSGMKAILNGILQLSTLDGWILEAPYREMGWPFGWTHEGAEVGNEYNLRLDEDSNRLYETLEMILNLYYATNRKDGTNVQSEWITKMIHAIAAAGYFNTSRMVEEYEKNIWQRVEQTTAHS